jgi:hypothetical protein
MSRPAPRRDAAGAVFLAFVNDRHTDPDAEAFTTAEAAITYARTTAQTFNRHPEDYREHPPPDGWLFSATYSVEGDSVWVVEKELKP